LENESQCMSQYALRAYNIMILKTIVQRFIDGKKPLTAQELADRLSLPIRLLKKVIDDLYASNLILEVVCVADEKVFAYAPAKDVRHYTIKNVMETLDKKGDNSILTEAKDVLNKVLHIQEKFLQIMERAPENILIHDLSDYETENHT